MASLLGLLTFGAGYVAAVWAGAPPGVRLRRAAAGLLIGLLVGALCGRVLQRLVVGGLTEAAADPEEPS